MIHGQSDIAIVREHGVPRSDRTLVFLSKLVDALVILSVLTVAVAAYGAHAWNLKYTNAALAAVILFVLIGEIAGIYRPWRGETATRQFFQILFVWIQTLFVLLLLAYMIKDTGSFSRVATGAWVVATPILLSGWRILARRIFQYAISQKDLQRNALVWGNDSSGEQLARTIEQSPWLGLNLVGHPDINLAVDPNTDDHISQATERGIQQIETRVRRGEIDIIYVALPHSGRAAVNELLERLADTTASVYLIPDAYTTSLMHGRWSNLAGIPSSAYTKHPSGVSTAG